MDIIINLYCNEHCTKTFNLMSKSDTSTPNAQTGLSVPKSTKESDFSTVYSNKNTKEERKATKKQ